MATTDTSSETVTVRDCRKMFAFTGSGIVMRFIIYATVILTLADGFVLNPMSSTSSVKVQQRAPSSSSSWFSSYVLADRTRPLHSCDPPASFIKSSRRRKSARDTRTQLNSVTAGIFQAIDTIWKANPYATAAIVCGIKAGLADFIAQKRQHVKESEAALTETAVAEDSNQSPSSSNDITATSATNMSLSSSRFDRRRNLGFLVYGSAYQGVGQEYIYNTLYPIMFGPGGDTLTVVKMVCFDLFIQTVFVTLPIAYYFKSIIFGTTFLESTKQYLSDIRHRGLLTKYFMLWGPVQAMTFSIVPHHLRITFIAMVSFFWVIILSSIAGRTDQPVTTLTSSPATHQSASAGLEDI